MKNIALICATGVGKRMGANLPKQYLPLTYQGEEQTILDITLKKFSDHPKIDLVIVSLAQNDSYFLQETKLNLDVSAEEFFTKRLNQHYLHLAEFNPELKKIYVVKGLGERYDTVYSMLSNAMAICQDLNWDPTEVNVLIHDAVRCGITADDISKVLSETQHLLTGKNLTSFLDSFKLGKEEFVAKYNHDQADSVHELEVFNEDGLNKDLRKEKLSKANLTKDENTVGLVPNEYYGGILPGIGVVDSIKRLDSHLAIANVDRNSLFISQTPQAFNLVYQYYLMSKLFEFSCFKLAERINQGISFYPSYSELVYSNKDLGFLDDIQYSWYLLGTKYQLPKQLLIDLLYDFRGKSSSSIELGENIFDSRRSLKDCSTSTSATSLFTLFEDGLKLIDLANWNSLSLEQRRKYLQAFFEQRLTLENQLQGGSLTDDTAVEIIYNDKVKVCYLQERNLKITVAEHLRLMQFYLNLESEQ